MSRFHACPSGEAEGDLDLDLAFLSEMSLSSRGIMGKQVQRIMVATSASLIICESIILKREIERERADVVNTYAHSPI